MDPYDVLGVPRNASAAEVRRAWIEGVRRHPPDRDPEGFQRLREAHDRLKDPWFRSTERLFGRSDLSSLSDLAEVFSGKRRWLGPEPWLRLIGRSER